MSRSWQGKDSNHSTWTFFSTLEPSVRVKVQVQSCDGHCWPGHTIPWTRAGLDKDTPVHVNGRNYKRPCTCAGKDRQRLTTKNRTSVRTSHQKFWIPEAIPSWNSNPQKKRFSVKKIHGCKPKTASTNASLVSKHLKKRQRLGCFPFIGYILRKRKNLLELNRLKVLRHPGSYYRKYYRVSQCQYISAGGNKIWYWTKLLTNGYFEQKINLVLAMAKFARLCQIRICLLHDFKSNSCKNARVLSTLWLCRVSLPLDSGSFWVENGWFVFWRAPKWWFG